MADEATGRAATKMPHGRDYSSEAQRIRVMQRWGNRPTFLLPPPGFVRVAPVKPLSAMEEIVCVLLGAGLDLAEIGEALDITRWTAGHHAKMAAKKLPGDLKGVEKCRAWARGAATDVLDGRALREWIHRTAAQSPFVTLPLAAHG